MIDITKFQWPELPVLTQKDAFLEAVQNHSVIILQGETGSGKTTQIPKLCIQAGLHEHGLIGCTQPRRIAALSICDRLRHETRQDHIIGAQIRFHNDCPKDMAIKVMTDGILLQEYQKDPLLKKYSCLIIDEAHERSLNIDILLGILNVLKEERPDLKIIITSATIDAQSFSEFFDNAPVIIAEGKTYPVETHYLDPEAYGDIDPLQLAAGAIVKLQEEEPDHTLCFLPTEKDILELRDQLQGSLDSRFDILPLYGRLTPQEQKQIFQETGKIKIVLSTNIAETSLTIPGIAYVVDLGLARVSRYHTSTRIQGLPIEAISQASANQRKGRAGRVKPGTCIRLYSEEQFNQRPEYTDPEILRSNLANVMLTMIQLGLDLERFPLLDPPKPSAIRGARIHLFELGALDGTSPHSELTPLGRSMLKLPLDVTLAHLLLKSKEYDVLAAALILASGLSIQDPRFFPRDPKERSLAEGKHNQVRHKHSDFMTLLGLWNRTWKHLGEDWTLNQLRKHCQEYHLSFLRMREWIQLYQQFSRLLKHDAKRLQLDLKGLHEDKVHQCLLSAFLGTLAKKETQERFYRLAGGRESWIFPGSVLFKKNPEWILASEIRETSKVYLARNCEIKPSWIPQVAAQFCKEQYDGIAWNRRTGYVEALRITTFKGLRIGAGQRIQYQNIDPSECIRVMWSEAIVQAQCLKKPHFLNHNLKVLKELEELQVQMRRSGLVPSDDQLLDYYLKKASEHPQLKDITDYKSLEKCIASQKLNGYLSFDAETWIQARQDEDQWFEEHAPDASPAIQLSELFPKRVQLGGQHRKVKYQFDHNSQDDGINIEIPFRELIHTRWSQLLNIIPGWHTRLLDHVIQESAPGQRKMFEAHHKEILEAWRQEMGEVECSPWMSLGLALEKMEVFEQYPHWNPHHFQLAKKQFAHLNLTFKLTDIHKTLELKPSDGPANWAQAKIQQLKHLPNAPFFEISQGLYHGYLPTGKSSSRPLVGIGQAQDAYWQHIILQTKEYWSQGNQRNWAEQFVDKWNIQGDRGEAWLLLGALSMKGLNKDQIIGWEAKLELPRDQLKKTSSQQKLNSLSALQDLHQIQRADPLPEMSAQIQWAHQYWQSKLPKPSTNDKISWKNHKKTWRQHCREALKASPLLAPLNPKLRSLLDQLEKSQDLTGPGILLQVLQELEDAQLDLFYQKRVTPEQQDDTSLTTDALAALKNKWK